MDGLLENAAVVGIHRKRGFPQLLGKAPQTAAGLSHISHRPYCHALFRDDRPLLGIDHNIWGSPTQNPEAPNTFNAAGFAEQAKIGRVVGEQAKGRC
jgi:hypothetical protein